MPLPFVNWRLNARRRGASHALERQLKYQLDRAGENASLHAETEAAMRSHSQEVRAKLEAIRPIGTQAHVLEVGSGSEGLIFFFEAENGIGIDPLAAHYASMLPWHRRVKTKVASGEALPFPDSSFDIVLCDNVVDHAEDPARIVAEMVRVLVPGGLLYFTVNVHSPFWHVAASLHAAWRAVGIPLEVAPFADHTVHLTLSGARKLFRGQPLRMVREQHNVAAARALARHAPPRHAGDVVKRLFFKNATYELIAEKTRHASPEPMAAPDFPA